MIMHNKQFKPLFTAASISSYVSAGGLGGLFLVFVLTRLEFRLLDGFSSVFTCFLDHVGHALLIMINRRAKS